MALLRNQLINFRFSRVKNSYKCQTIPIKSYTLSKTNIANPPKKLVCIFYDLKQMPQNPKMK